jgi:hypothetical protein
MLPGPAVYKVTAGSQNQERSGKTVSFALPVATKPTVLKIAPLDLCSVQNICVYVQKSLQNSATLSPIGYLQRRRTYKHFIFPPKTAKLCTGPIMSLGDALLAARIAGGIRMPEKLRLAKLFALAVLQFHSTPWLNENWRSQDILFFNLMDPSEDYLGSPYLTARITKPSDNTTCKLSDPKESTPKSLFPVPNVILFRLGVILLELGLDMPFGDLQKAQEQKEEHNKEFAEFFTARRLALSSAVSRKMGPRYAKLVNRCLFCDFGLGGDYELDIIELQNMFFQYVVLELGACLKLVSEL